MKRNKLLFPHKCQPLGYVLLVAGIVLLGVNDFFNLDFSLNDIRSLIGLDSRPVTDEGSLLTFTPDTGLMFTIAGILFSLGSLFAGFSKFKIEDEYYEKIRLDSLLLSFYLYVVYLLGILLFTWKIMFLELTVWGCLGMMVFYVAVLTIKTFLAEKEAKNEK